MRRNVAHTEGWRGFARGGEGEEGEAGVGVGGRPC